MHNGRRGFDSAPRILAALALAGCGAEARSSGNFAGAAGESDDGGFTGGSGATTRPGASGADGGADSSDGDDPAPKFDVMDGEGPGPGDDGGLPGACGCGEDEWSYIWVANSTQSTVSKINTRTRVEEGRYYTRGDHNGNPSRTSVSLGGRAAAVANRNGGVVKIWAREQFCEDRNGNGTIETSAGPGDILPWGTDECIAWSRDFPSYNAQRPVAWAGNVNPQSCDDEQLWTSGCSGSFGIDVHLLDGVTGDTLDMVSIPELFCGGFGGYGGAVDPEGNFWVAMNGTGGTGLARVTPDMQVSLWAYPAGLSGYGLAVDNRGRAWVSSYGSVGVGRFDPATETWTTGGNFTSQGGIAQGEDERIWVSTGNGVAVVAPDSLAVLDLLSVPGGTVKGISLDVDGNLWAVSGSAYQYDADTLAPIGEVGGLVGPYTYSDMTGWGLQNAHCNPPAG